jgi:transposase, IS6 family
VILSAIFEKLKRRSKDDFKDRHFEASLILQAVHRTAYIRICHRLQLCT